jgi:hypothetical protein
MTGLCVAVRIFARLGWDPGCSPRFLAFKDRAIDRRFRMSTVGVVRPDDLDVDLDQREHAIQYQPTASLDLAIVLDELADRTGLTEHSFIGFGSGRGRVICLAAEFPFKASVGVEFSEKLHKDACRNVTFSKVGGNAAERSNRYAWMRQNIQYRMGQLYCSSLTRLTMSSCRRFLRTSINHGWNRKETSFAFTTTLFTGRCLMSPNSGTRCRICRSSMSSGRSTVRELCQNW